MFKRTVDKSVERDFGKGFLFSEKTLNVTEEALETYKTGTLQKPYAQYQTGEYKYDKCDVLVYTGGQYPKVVRLCKDMPTFDSGDREYDSWHDLYLVQEQSGTSHAVYCTGGYRVATIQGYAKVYEYPRELKQYF